MQTPKEAFDEMCACHGEIWARTENGWSCIRKSEQGTRSVHWDIQPPLVVVDLLNHTGCTFALFSTLSGYLELLVSKAARTKLEQEHTPEQLAREAARLAKQRVDRQKVIDAIKHTAEGALDREMGSTHGDKHGMN